MNDSGFQVPMRFLTYTVELPLDVQWPPQPVATCDKLRWMCGWEHEAMIEVLDADRKDHPAPLFTINFDMFDPRVADTLKDLVR